MAPTCIDGKQNGKELGIDCGGTCALVCPFQANDIKIVWTRVFKVVDGRYNAVAYLQNQNTNFASAKVHYKFRFSDKNNIYVGSREGDTYVPTGGNFVVFEPAIDTGSEVPVFTTFEFTEKPIWFNVPDNTIQEFKVVSSNISLANEMTSPILTATLKNISLFQIQNLKIVTILYDKSGNAINASSTLLNTINGGETLPIIFTWPEPITGGVVSKEIIPMFDIFSLRLN